MQVKRRPRAAKELGEKAYSYPLTKKERDKLIKKYAEKYGLPRHVVKNTVEQAGWDHLLKALEKYKPRPRPTLWERLRRWLGV